MRSCTAQSGVRLYEYIHQSSRKSLNATNALLKPSNGSPAPSLITRPSTQCRSLHSIPLCPFPSPKLRPKAPPTSLSLQSKRHFKRPRKPLPGAKRAYIALGSNVGDRIAMIEQACNEMDAGGKILVLRTSSLWETKAMYVEDQEDFINGVCEIGTFLKPIELLDELQRIENKMGRVKLVDKGPRNIDLDILVYGSEKVSTDRLQIPHPLMLEREFVLRPLCDIAPDFKIQVPGRVGKRMTAHLGEIKPDPKMGPVTPLGRTQCLPRLSNQATKIMSIINVTPDSFSDGGKNYNLDEISLTATIKSHIAAGATILDIGGQSTRPGAVQVSPQEELSRVLPAIKLIRSLPEAENIAISVDTYRASVAEAAIEAGADIINDISAGQMDKDMLPTIARLGCTYCMMHMRGTPETMTQMTDYSPRGVIQGLTMELRRRLFEADAAGIRRWRIILDPGIGFAKDVDQNLGIIRSLNNLRRWTRHDSLPWLVGASRKTFIGEITGVEEPENRTFGTAAVVTAAIQGGADIVRVHDVEEMAQVVKMADAIYRV
ncbi:Dihydropteroate synthase [Pleomassaria siparia CBS 279.74]|uniref:Folic acid synthesis protein FOL1 n=1 Tax=Pleomassaria siparia CBS 279.74 TaxID=1314801 RepID=A0A6G1JVM4_9PLEO|nr:Dihydropteroate synthase [Pleomassaria siparia CBS 279.74]